MAALDQTAWENLCDAVGRSDLASNSRFADAEARARHNDDLASELSAVFGRRPAAEWFTALDGLKVPCEISDPDFVLRLFSDPTAEERKVVSAFRHPVVGDMKMAGLYFDLSDTPGKIWGPPAWPGQNTRQILTEVGYSPDEVDKLLASGAADDTAG